MKIVIGTKALLSSIILLSQGPASASAICADYMILDTRGTGHPQGSSISYSGMMNQTLSTVPHGGHLNTVYPAEYDLTQQTTLIGSAWVEKVLRLSHKQCPSQKFALIGYSQGAIVSSIALRSFATTSPEGQAIKAVVLLGNPYHIPNKAGNVDDKCGSSTAAGDGVLNAHADYRVPEQWYETGKVLDLCYSGDDICWGGEDLFGPAHLAYEDSKSVQKCGADFLIAKLS